MTCMHDQQIKDIKLFKCRKLGGIHCQTATDILEGLGNLKSQSDKRFINSLHRAIYEGDLDIIAGHIDWFRVKAGMPILTQTERKELSHFYKEYLAKHPPDGMLRMAQFISAALEHFS